MKLDITKLLQNGYSKEDIFAAIDKYISAISEDKPLQYMNLISFTADNTYTYSLDHLEDASINSEITVYLTVMEKNDNGKWVTEYSLEGEAPVIKINNKDRGIDPKKWYEV